MRLSEAIFIHRVSMTGKKETQAMSIAASLILLSTSQAAEFVRLSPRTLEGLRVRGGGPLYRKIGRVYYSQSDLIAWLDAAARTSTSDRGVA